ncbi:MAG: Nif3-like dinuclear metal center hexameric protein [Anaerolineae bacterium]|nr:Nif3-like dinuclear metal center hexameric protein [Anaerolineae bacterium]
MKLDLLVEYLNDYLHIFEIADYGPQGLQVETENDEVRRVALAVDVSPTIIETAVAWQADLLLVHHGILWRSVERIAGPFGLRVRLLMKYGLNLYAAHLPLDAHPEVGNNTVLARLLGLQIADWWYAPKGTPIGVFGHLQNRPSLSELVQQVEQSLETQVTVLPNGPQTVQHMAIISGAGAEQIAEAKALGADTFLTGETSHQNYWAAADYGMNIIFAGHYATETVGVKALGQHLAERFDLELKFFDFPTNM